MKVVSASDLHGIQRLYVQLLKLVSVEKPKVIILGGDLLPDGGPFKSTLKIQKTFIETAIRSRLMKVKRLEKAIRTHAPNL